MKAAFATLALIIASATAALADAMPQPDPSLRVDRSRQGGRPDAASAAPRPQQDGDGDIEELVLECANIRRLNDKFLVDWRMKLEINWSTQTYHRFDNAGRGWHPTGEFRIARVDKAHITLIDDARSHSYIERYSGFFYVLNRENADLSVWGRCARSGKL